MLDNFFETIINENDYICGNKFIDLTNFKDTQFCKTDFISEYSNQYIKKFITHNSDYSIDDKTIKSGPKFDLWYAQNKDTNNENVITIPIGLENFESNFTHKSMFSKHSSLPSNSFYKKEYINELSKTFEKKTHLVYLNFNPSTYLKERNYVLNLFFNKNWVCYNNNITWKQYYDGLYKSKFVFSPRGNGIDCHRTWEALYLRTIPIVIKTSCMNEFKDLPILFIDSWEQINEDFLLTKYEEMNNIKYNLNKCKMSYWIQRIMNE